MRFQVVSDPASVRIDRLSRRVCELWGKEQQNHSGHPYPSVEPSLTCTMASASDCLTLGTMSSYVYEELPTPTSIRLPRLETGVEIDPVRCEFTFFPISLEPEEEACEQSYESISYA
jgi:hypothetical protein